MLIEPEKASYINDSLPLTPISQPYLLVIGITCYRDQKGYRYLDRLWHKDLLEHFRYLKDFTLASPCQHGEPPKDTISLDGDTRFSHIKFIDLPSPSSFAEAIMLMPITTIKLWQAIGQAAIVHTGVAGWPIPMGWLVTPIVWLRPKLYVIIVESAFWRLLPNVPTTIKSKLRAYIFETLNRWCVNNADLAIFTQEEYYKSLLTKRQDRGHIIHASWIDEENIISIVDATKIWHQKLSSATKELKVLYAGRLTTSKGVLILLEAMKALNNEDIPIKLDIVGQGELLSECEKVSKSLQKSIKIEILQPVPYGPEFFNLLQNYHALVVPSISDEQPRVVYDAYSQAIPVLASDTPGLRDCIQNGKTGMITNPNDSTALADLLKFSWLNLSKLQSMGIASVEVACQMTHQNMHRKRWQLLLEMLNESVVVK